MDEIKVDGTTYKVISYDTINDVATVKWNEPCVRCGKIISIAQISLSNVCEQVGITTQCPHCGSIDM